MGLFDRVRDIFKKKEQIPTDPGVILLKPSEAGAAAGLAAKTGAIIEIPETGKVYVPETKKFVSYEEAPITTRRRITTRRKYTPSQQELLAAMPKPPIEPRVELPKPPIEPIVEPPKPPTKLIVPTLLRPPTTAELLRGERITGAQRVQQIIQQQIAKRRERKEEERIRREEFERERARREAYRAEVGAVTIKDVAKKLDMPEEKIIEAVEYLPPIDEKRPLYMEEWVPFTEKELEYAELQKTLRLKGWPRRKIKEFIEWLPLIIPFEKKMEEKEMERRRELGKYVPTIKDGELVAAKLISPPEVPYYEAQAEIAFTADETARNLLDKYTTQRDEEMNTYTKRLEKDIDEGRISTPEANRQLQDYNQRYGELLDKEIEKEYMDKLIPIIEEKQGLAKEDAKRETKKYRLDVSLANLPLTIAAGATIGAISVLAPPIGVAYAGIMGAKLVTHIPETLAYARAAPLATAVEFGGFMAGGASAGGLARGVKLKYIAKSDLKAAIAKLPKAKQVEFMKYWNEVQKLEAKAWYVPTRNVDFTGMNRLPTRLHNPTKNFIKSKGDIIGGSQGMRTMMHGKAKPPLSRWAESDVDLFTTGNPLTRVNELANLYRSYGIERVSTVKGKVTIAGVKVVEYHPLEMLYNNLRSVTPYYKSLRSNIRTTPEGIKVAPILGAQAKRKLVGSYLDSRYSKDFPDFMKIEQALIQEAGILKRLKLPEPKPKIKPLVEDIFKIKGKKVIPTKIKPFKAPKVTDPFKISKIKPKVKEYPYALYPKARTLPFLVPPYPGYKKAKGIPSIIPYKVPTKVLKITPLIPYKVITKVPKVTPIIPYKVPFKVPTIKLIIPSKPPKVTKPIIPYKPVKPSPYKPIRPYKPFKRIELKVRPPIRIKRKVPPKKKKIKKKIETKKGDYTGYIRRFKKWKAVAVGKKEKVISKAKKKIMEELGASYKVQGPYPSKKYVQIPIVNKKMFRRSKSKREPYVVIERKKYRLDSPKEVREIKAHKGAAPKKPTKKTKKGRTTKKRSMFFR